MKENIKVKELAKKQIAYDKQVALFGKEAADNVLSFWMLGYNYRKREESN